ncbi:hypothetical protein J437_LFUL002963 [Ladona fulva]|uniref:G-protein coupled receptors family 1 profile domain-containing protein n=1 Tax=Ladona fulva TaxID=123851 RepID=A0A8K0P098_LADFU|nr:hypothetical protein J437_LFUL002963 [Ladona fulva]
MSAAWPQVNFSDPEEEVAATTELPEDMRFNAGHVVSISTYSVLLVISAIGNISVTFLMMPLEIGWAATVTWTAGDIACRVMAFFRVFGLFLSGFVLACVSIDRYYAVLKPLQLNYVNRRMKVMLSVAWIASIVCSLPQSVVFHVEYHPNITWYAQCVTYHAFPSPTYELTYSLFGMVMMYAFPLLVITFAYTSILAEIFRRSRDSGPEMDDIRRSSLGYLGRAKVRTLKMTITIVVVFFVCWTPYNVISLWYWFDKKTAKLLDQRAQKALFLFACTNSCANPLVYGLFNFRRDRGRFRQRQRGTRCSRGTVIGAQRFDRSLSDPRDDMLMESRWKTFPPTESRGVTRNQLEEHNGKRKAENGGLL